MKGKLAMKGQLAMKGKPRSPRSPSAQVLQRTAWSSLLEVKMYLKILAS
jgi:hypothetical protein